jgi:hypothetical protein
MTYNFFNLECIVREEFNRLLINNMEEIGYINSVQGNQLPAFSILN